MRRFFLYGDMASRFGSHFDLESNSIREVYHALDANHSGFKKFLINKAINGVNYAFISNKKDKIESYCSDIILKEKEYHIVPVLEGSSSAASMGMGIGGFFGNLAAGFLMQKMSDIFKPEDDGIPEYEIITTNSFIYNQNENRVEQGTPIPVVYGQLRVGSQVICSNIENYDYDYDQAKIYKPRSKDHLLVTSDFIGDSSPSPQPFTHKLFNALNIFDLRDEDSAIEAFSSYAASSSDGTKRSIYDGKFYDGKNAKKQFVTPTDSETQGITNVGVYGSPSNTTQEYYGPSIGSAMYSNAAPSWWDVAQAGGPRPFLFPKSSHRDFPMRPASSQSLCVQSTVINGVSQNANNLDSIHAWARPSKPLTVGNRGNYQKLESISFYRSLEILSEGPIAGLANPITGFNRDNGTFAYPYESEGISTSSKNIELPDLKYDFATDSILTQSNQSSITPTVAGEGYPNFNGVIVGDGKYNNAGLYIKASNPARLDIASIGDIYFSNAESKTVNAIDNTASEDTYFVSSNNLFLLNSGDGSITANTNNDISQFDSQKVLESKYLQSESTELGNTGVFQLYQLVSDNTTLGENYAMGIGYSPSETLRFEIEPDNNVPTLDITTLDTFATDRIYTATVADAKTYMDLVKETSTPTEFGDIFNRDYYNSTASNFLGEDWSDIARIVLDSSDSTLNLTDHLTKTVTVNVGTRSDDYVFINDCSGTFQDSCSDPSDRRFGTKNSGTVTLTISFAQYLNLNTSISTSNLGDPGRDTSGISCFCEWGATTYSAIASSDKNGDGVAEFTNLVVNRNSVALGYLLKSNTTLSETIFDLFAAQIPGMSTLKRVTSSGVYYFAFGVGSGPTQRQGWRTGSLPTSSVIGGFNNLESLKITDPGYAPEDGTSAFNTIKKGFYNPLLFPRVTIFILRKAKIDTNGNTADEYYFCPTRIDCIARVRSSGTIEDLHILSVPGKPIWDPKGQSWTNFQPWAQSSGRYVTGSGNNLGKYFHYSPTHLDDQMGSGYGAILDYQDLAVACLIDPSNDSFDIKFTIDDSNAISVTKTANGSEKLAHSLQSSWGNHIAYNVGKNVFQISSTDYTYGAGIFPIINNDLAYFGGALNKNFSIEPSHLDPDLAGTSNASIDIEVEQLGLASTRVPTLINRVTGQLVSSVCTGRPTKLTILNGGSFSTKQGESIRGRSFDYSVFNRSTKIANLSLRNGKGYRPNSTFIVEGYPSKLDGLKNSIFCFKASVDTDDSGGIADVTIIDGGFGFTKDSNNKYGLDYDFEIITDSLFWAQAVTRAQVSPFSTRALTPSVLFPKSNFIVRVDKLHISEPSFRGSIAKFYIESNGSGFNHDQIISNPFAEFAFQPPSFSVVIQNGSLVSINVLNAGESGSQKARGYSSDDSAISLTFSRPPQGTEVPPDNPDTDEYSWARAIFLNDIPIRDKNGLFNFSKFHWDLRIGNYQNGYLENNSTITNKLPESSSSDNSRDNIIDTEFRVPAYTKMVDFNLYGPRNHGEKDYYYAHTIKNPNINAVTISLKVNQLHYIYEGDESALYVNLVPLVGMAVGMAIGEAVVQSMISQLIPEKVIGKGTGSVTTAVSGCVSGSGSAQTAVTAATTSTFRGAAAKALAAGFASALGGTLAGFILGSVLDTLFECSQVPFLCFKVGELIKNSGEIWPAKVEVAIEYGTAGSPLKTDVVTIQGCATNPYVKDIIIDDLPLSKGDSNTYKNRVIKVYRVTRAMDPVRGGLAESRYSIDVGVHSITEHVAGYFSYPNTAIIGTRINSKDFSQIPRKEYLLKGRIIKIPSNYNSQTGTYAGTWDGTFIDEWTSNPAWIIYDLLINERYGMGKYGITENQIDKWSFYEFSKFCDERVPTVIDGELNNGQIYNERRHMCNLYVDSEVQAYDYIKDLLKIYNSSINFSGGKIYINPDKKGESIMIFNNSNISEDGFSYSSTPETARITAASVDYLDERDNYMRKTEYVEDQQGVSEHGYSHLKIAGIGITRRGEAHRLAWHTILNRQMEKEIISFQAGMQSAYLRIGDIIEVMDNDKISHKSGGRVISILDESRSSAFFYQIELDIPASALLTSAQNPAILIEHNPVNASWLPVNNYIMGETVISSLDGNFYVLTSDALNGNANNLDPSLDSTNWSVSPESSRNPAYMEAQIRAGTNFSYLIESSQSINFKSGSAWILKQHTEEEIRPKKYKVISISEKEDLVFDITALEYLEEKYNQIENSSSNAGIDNSDRDYYGHEVLTPNS